MSARTLRLARFLTSHQRVSVHFDPQTKQTYRFLERQNVLEKYKGQKDVFGSFTSIKKLGINPSTGYKTPIGVYAYPIDYVISEYNPRTEDFEVPWPPSERKLFLQIFRVKDLSRCLVFNEGDNNQVLAFKSPDKVTGEQAVRSFGSWAHIIGSIHEYYNQNLNLLNLEDPKNVVNWLYKPLDTLRDEFYIEGPNKVITGEVREYFAIAFIRQSHLDVESFLRTPLGKRLREIKEAGHVDYPQEILDAHENLLSENLKSSIKFPYEDKFIELFFDIDPDGTEDDYQDFRDRVLGPGEKLACDQAFVWNATRHLSELKPAKWTDFMRRVGLIGAIDNGTGTIHGSEPTQAIFFDPQSIQPLESIDNKSDKYDPSDKIKDQRRDLYNLTNYADEIEVNDRINDQLDRMENNNRNIRLEIESNVGRYRFENYLRNFNDSINILYSVFGWLKSHPHLIDRSFLEDRKPKITTVINDTINTINLGNEKLGGNLTSSMMLTESVIRKLNMLLKVLG